MENVVVVVGAGQIGLAMARRVGVGKHVVLEQFGNVMARGESGVVISSQSGHRLPALTIEQNKALAMTPTENSSSCPSSNSIR